MSEPPRKIACMFDDEALSGTAELQAIVAALRRLDCVADDAVRIDQIRLLEEVRCAAAAAQATVTKAFVESQRRAAVAAGEQPDRAERGIAHQIALARRMSPYRAAREAGWAGILINELPHTFC